MKTPTRIDPSPLVEAVADVRFLPCVPPGAVFGYIHGLIKDRYGKLAGLPILQIPEEIRENDPNLIFQPHYRLESRPFVMQVGPRIVNIAALDRDYPGWASFRDEICAIIDVLFEKGVIDKVTRVGMRYINLFDRNVFEVSNFSVTLAGTDLGSEKTFVRVQFADKDVITAVQVANDASLNVNRDTRHGSIIDLDTFCLRPDLTDKPSERFRNLIEDAHSTLKSRFFSCLKEEFVASLNPQYE